MSDSQMIDPVTVMLVARITGAGIPESEAIAAKIGEWGREKLPDLCRSGAPGLRDEIYRRAGDDSPEQPQEPEADDSTPAE